MFFFHDDSHLNKNSERLQIGDSQWDSHLHLVYSSFQLRIEMVIQVGFHKKMLFALLSN